MFSSLSAFHIRESEAPHFTNCSVGLFPNEQEKASNGDSSTDGYISVGIIDGSSIDSFILSSSNESSRTEHRTLPNSIVDVAHNAESLGDLNSF